jgi:hypothetical protein
MPKKYERKKNNHWMKNHCSLSLQGGGDCKSSKTVLPQCHLPSNPPPQFCVTPHTGLPIIKVHLWMCVCGGLGEDWQGVVWSQHDVGVVRKTKPIRPVFLCDGSLCLLQLVVILKFKKKLNFDPIFKKGNLSSDYNSYR